MGIQSMCSIRSAKRTKGALITGCIQRKTNQEKNTVQPRSKDKGHLQVNKKSEEVVPILKQSFNQIKRLEETTLQPQF